jgi:hypothetical protein
MSGARGSSLSPRRGAGRSARAAACVAALAAAAALAACSSGQRSGAGPERPRVYSFWPPLPNEPRVQFLTSFQFSSDVERPPSALDQILLGREREIIPIAKPYGVAVRNGRVYVCDIVNPGVVILDLVNRQTWIMYTVRGEPMRQPTDIAIASDGMKYVADRRVARIFVFDSDDRHIATFGPANLVPTGVAVYGDELYVPDLGTRTVQVLNRFSGAILRSIGDPAQFVSPLGVDVDGKGNLYVTDAIRGRLYKYGLDGTLIYAKGEIGDAPGDFARPKHVAVDGDGTVYVVDAAFQNVQMFNEQGDLLMFFGGGGFNEGAMSLPAGIAIVDGDFELLKPYVHPAFAVERLALVTNQFGLNKVAVYALGHLKQGCTIDDIAPYAVQTDSGPRQQQVGVEPAPPSARPDAEAASPEGGP